jgi:hypothetical protein
MVEYEPETDWPFSPEAIAGLEEYVKYDETSNNTDIVVKFIEIVNAIIVDFTFASELLRNRMNVPEEVLDILSVLPNEEVTYKVGMNLQREIFVHLIFACKYIKSNASNVTPPNKMVLDILAMFFVLLKCVNFDDLIGVRTTVKVMHNYFHTGTKQPVKVLDSGYKNFDLWFKYFTNRVDDSLPATGMDYAFGKFPQMDKKLTELEINMESDRENRYSYQSYIGRDKKPKTIIAYTPNTYTLDLDHEIIYKIPGWSRSKTIKETDKSDSRKEQYGKYVPNQDDGHNYEKFLKTGLVFTSRKYETKVGHRNTINGKIVYLVKPVEKQQLPKEEVGSLLSQGQNTVPEEAVKSPNAVRKPRRRGRHRIVITVGEYMREVTELANTIKLLEEIKIPFSPDLYENVKFDRQHENDDIVYDLKDRVNKLIANGVKSIDKINMLVKLIEISDIAMKATDLNRGVVERIRKELISNLQESKGVYELADIVVKLTERINFGDLIKSIKAVTATTTTTTTSTDVYESGQYSIFGVEYVNYAKSVIKTHLKDAGFKKWADTQLSMIKAIVYSFPILPDQDGDINNYMTKLEEAGRDINTALFVLLTPVKQPKRKVEWAEKLITSKTKKPPESKILKPQKKVDMDMDVDIVGLETLAKELSSGIVTADAYKAAAVKLFREFDKLRALGIEVKASYTDNIEISIEGSQYEFTLKRFIKSWENNGKMRIMNIKKLDKLITMTNNAKKIGDTKSSLIKEIQAALKQDQNESVKILNIAKEVMNKFDGIITFYRLKYGIRRMERHNIKREEYYYEEPHIFTNEYVKYVENVMKGQPPQKDSLDVFFIKLVNHQLNMISVIENSFKVRRVETNEISDYLEGLKKARDILQSYSPVVF